MAEIRGVLLNAVMSFLRKRFGEQAVDEAISRLSPTDRALLRDMILDATWYPLDALGPVRRVSAVLSTDPGPALAMEMGRHSADYVFGGVYKALLNNDPAKLIEKFSWLHDFFYREAFTLTTELPAPGACCLRYVYRNGVRPARSSCNNMIGFWTRTMELAGGTAVAIRHSKCRADGADLCEYQITWH